MKNIDKGIELSGMTADELYEGNCPRNFDIHTDGCREDDCALCWNEEYKGKLVCLIKE